MIIFHNFTVFTVFLLKKKSVLVSIRDYVMQHLSHMCELRGDYRWLRELSWSQGKPTHRCCTLITSPRAHQLPNFWHPSETFHNSSKTHQTIHTLTLTSIDNGWTVQTHLESLDSASSWYCTILYFPAVKRKKIERANYEGRKEAVWKCLRKLQQYFFVLNE